MDILKIKTSNIKPAKGKFLIAEPFLDDPDFSRAVVFICEHGPEGTIGFVVNRPTFYTIDHLLPELGIPSLPVYEGGPVQPDHLHLLHRIPNTMAGIEIIPEVFWGGSYVDLAKIKDASVGDLNNIRLFSGYSGWEAGQLEEELDQGAWIVANAVPDLIFEGEMRKIWSCALHSLGKEFAYLTNFPINPHLN